MARENDETVAVARVTGAGMRLTTIIASRLEDKNVAIHYLSRLKIATVRRIVSWSMVGTDMGVAPRLPHSRDAYSQATRPSTVAWTGTTLTLCLIQTISLRATILASSNKIMIVGTTEGQDAMTGTED